MKRFLALASTLFGLPLAAQQFCPATNDTIVVYGNGVRTTQPQAESELSYMLESLQPFAQSRGIDPAVIPGCLAYDSTYVESQNSQLGSIGDIVDTPLQFWQAYLQTQLQPVQQFWYWLSNVQAAPAWFNQVEQDLGVAIGTGVSALLQPDILNQLQMYRRALLPFPDRAGYSARQQTLIVVAHSQGNLYANQAYDLLFPSASSLGANRFKLISVATPADHVAGGGPYTTLFEDPIWLVPGALQWNTSNCNSTCLPSVANHDFTSSYLDGVISGPQILGEIASAIPTPQRITVELSGTVSFVTDPNHRLAGLVAVGNHVSGSFTYDPNVPNTQNNGSLSATYNENLLGTGLTYTIQGPSGPKSFTRVPPDQGGFFSINTTIYSSSESALNIVNSGVIAPSGFPSATGMAVTFINQGPPTLLTSLALPTNWSFINLPVDQSDQSAVIGADWDVRFRFTSLSQH